MVPTCMPTLKIIPKSYVDPYGLFAESLSKYASRQAQIMADQLWRDTRNAVKRLPSVRFFSENKKKAAAAAHGTADFALETLHGIESGALAVGSSDLDLSFGERSGVFQSHSNLQEQRASSLSKFLMNRHGIDEDDAAYNSYRNGTRLGLEIGSFVAGGYGAVKGVIEFSKLARIPVQASRSLKKTANTNFQKFDKS